MEKTELTVEERITLLNLAISHAITRQGQDRASAVEIAVEFEAYVRGEVPRD